MKRILVLSCLLMLNTGYAQDSKNKEVTIHDLVCDVEGFSSKIINKAIVQKVLPKDTVTVLIKRSTEKFNESKKEIYMRMQPRSGGFEKFEYIAIIGKFQEKSESLYWDLSNNDYYQLKQTDLQFNSPNTFKYVFIDKLTGEIVLKEFSFQDNLNLKYLTGKCTPKEAVKVIK